MSIEIEEEPVSWFTIACLFTAVAVAFTYRFFGPDSGQPTQKKETAEKVHKFYHEKLFIFLNRCVINFAASKSATKRQLFLINLIFSNVLINFRMNYLCREINFGSFESKIFRHPKVQKTSQLLRRLLKRCRWLSHLQLSKIQRTLQTLPISKTFPSQKFLPVKKLV